VGKVALEAEVLAELQHLTELAKRMITGESLKATPLADLDATDGTADIMTIIDGGKEFIFINCESDEVANNYLELRSTMFPEMAISLPRPAFTRVSQESVHMDEAALAKWREDLC